MGHHDYVPVAMLAHLKNLQGAGGHLRTSGELLPGPGLLEWLCRNATISQKHAMLFPSISYVSLSEMGFIIYQIT